MDRTTIIIFYEIVLFGGIDKWKRFLWLHGPYPTWYLPSPFLRCPFLVLWVSTEDCRSSSPSVPMFNLDRSHNSRLPLDRYHKLSGFFLLWPSPFPDFSQFQRHDRNFIIYQGEKNRTELLLWRSQCSSILVIGTSTSLYFPVGWIRRWVLCLKRTVGQRRTGGYYTSSDPSLTLSNSITSFFSQTPVYLTRNFRLCVIETLVSDYCRRDPLSTEQPIYDNVMDRVSQKRPLPDLIHGVTPSGKTTSCLP